MNKNTFQIFSEAYKEEYSPLFFIRIIWKINSDRTYVRISDNTKCFSDIPEYISVRTLSGRGQLTVDGKTFILDDNSLLFLNKNKLLSYFCAGESWNFIWSEFRTTQSLPLYRLFHLDYSKEEELSVNRCFDLMQFQNNIQLASALFLRQLLDWLKQIDINGNIKNVYHHQLIEQALKYIPVNIYKRITVKELAELCHVSERYFRKLFIEYTNTPPSEYILNQKIQLCKELLKSSASSINEIAELTGFCDSYHFGRIFKKRVGMSPGKYRKGTNYLSKESST